MPKRGKTGWKDENGDYLIVVEADRYGDKFKIAWMIAEDGDVGGDLGDRGGHEQPYKELHRLATDAGGKRMAGHAPFIWDSKKKADDALRFINAGMLAFDAGKPWPEWALKAKAAGWTPPKGWSL